MLRVRVLGELALEVDGEEMEAPSSRRARSLLGLLAVDRRTHSRSQLAARFWPDVLDESARTSLRSALSALRKALGPDADRYLVADRESLGLAGEKLVWTDLSEFDSLLAEGADEEALELCRGELLDGLDDEWAHERREEHRERVAGALARLAAEAERSDDLTAAVALTRRQAALDPLAEEPQRQLIRLLAAAGDRPAALAAYGRLQDRLRSELGIAPSAQTRELVAALRDGDTPQPSAQPTSSDASLGEASVGAPPSRPTGTVTLLFTDQVSSTETLQRLGDDEGERLRRTHFALLREVAGAHGGQEVKNLGDGLMVAFASALDAVACAIGIQQAVHRAAERDGEERLGVRVGLNVGEPIVDEDDYFGTPVVVAKRLCDAAQEGQILASDVVRALVGSRGGFEFRALGATPLKGLGDPVDACEVLWEPTSAQRLPMPAAIAGSDSDRLVGRATELAELRRRWDDVRRDEARRVVLIAGEPGIGKTRLATELCRAAHEEGAAVLAGRCYEETAFPYQPFVEALREYVRGCPPGELTVQVTPRRGELAALVPELDADSPEPPPTGAEPERERFRVFEAVASLLNEAALSRPTILLLDDLHWADEASLLLLRHIVRSSEESRLLVLGTYRQTEPDAGGALTAAIAEMRRARALVPVELEGLPEEEVAALIAAESGEEAPGGFARQVAERTAGNPFFIEELLRYVEDPVHPDLGVSAVPDSVKDLLLRRIERLGESCRTALATAAVAGPQFELAVLEPVLEIPAEELIDLLEEAVRQQVLVEEAGAFGRYGFAHPLIRETIYEDISANRRALTHRRVGEAIESVHAGRLAVQAGALAYHYEAAGDTEKAFEYHCRAAEEADRGMAPEAAFDHLSGAIAAGERLGRTAHADAAMRDLRRRRAWIGQFTGAEEMAKSDYAVALEGARLAGDRTLEMQALHGLGVLWHLRDNAVATRYNEQSLAIAEQLGDEAGQVSALDRLSLLHANQLDLEQALELGERALDLGRASGDEQAVSRALDSLKFVALMLGDTHRLEELATELERVQRQRGDPWLLEWTLLESAFAPTAQGRWSEAAGRLEEAMAINRRIGDELTRGMILAAQSRLERSRGDYRRALAVGEEAVRATAREPNDVWLGWTSSTLALALGDLRAWPEALEAQERALEAADRIEARAQSFGVLGELAWTRLQIGDEAGARRATARWDEAAAAVRIPAGHAYLYWPGTYLGRARAELAFGEVDQAEAILLEVREPIGRFGIRGAAAEADAALAACAETRGDRAAAERLLSRGLEAAGGEGLPAARLTIEIGLARVAASADVAAAHAGAARALVEEIGESAGDEALADRLRSAAARELDDGRPPAG